MPQAQSFDRPEKEPPDAPEDGLRSLQGELILLIADQARRVPFLVVFSAGLVALLVAAHVPPMYPAAWWVLTALATWVHSRIVGGLPSDGARSEAARLRLAALSFTGHAMVLAAVFAFFPFVPVTTGAVITIYSVALCAATLPATAGYRPIFLPYAVVTLGPIAPLWALTPGIAASGFDRLVFVVMTAVYFAAMLGHAKGAYRVFTESYAIRQQRLDLNRQLRRALEQAQSASRAKTRFLASASHDLRQPIHALSLFTGSLLMRPLDPRTSAIAEQIDKSVKTLASQLDALLDVSRLDAGVIDRAIETVDLKVLLTQLGEEFAPQAQKKGLRLHVHCPQSVLVSTDPLLFQRILRNLLSNAIKYTEHGHVELRAQALGDKVRVSVADTGPGIPAEEQERVFEEFYQLNNPERDRSKGLGLGLAIVRRLTALLDLELRLESAVGQGSCFSVDVPAAAQRETSMLDTQAAQVTAEASRIQVLVVDDEETIRLGMKTLLEEMGFGVEAVSSTEAAIECSRRFCPSVVLADFRLRGSDSGIRTIQALRAVWPDLPALLISGDTAPDRLREAHDAGVKLLHKPVAASALRDAIIEAVQA
ncbi:Signal transduction histidine kinase [Fontimonas thermophila]|uniref:histidine kinase n=1 Tax=Fontimonas thermophila TaxID=1076937 RepID=A0A1I2I4S4_9GAMM|nr:hybrid sensor histidine kinase/response regulator [Fontimonas thermophila]SFF37459.1 Signal transduction histidine kinase [Fontimonas thermophila]